MPYHGFIRRDGVSTRYDVSHYWAGERHDRVPCWHIFYRGCGGVMYVVSRKYIFFRIGCHKFFYMFTMCRE